MAEVVVVMGAPLPGRDRAGSRLDQAHRVGQEHLLELLGVDRSRLVGQQCLQPMPRLMA
jgi:hypothetical protein